MCDGFPAARHDAVTELDDLGNADNLLGVVAFIRQQHQKEENAGDDGFRIPAQEVQHMFQFRGQGLHKYAESNMMQIDYLDGFIMI